MRPIDTTVTDLVPLTPTPSGGHTIVAHVIASPLADAAAVAHVPHTGALLAVGAAGSAVAGTVVAYARGVGRRHGWLTLWVRLRLRIYPGPGFATRWDLYRRYGKPAARKVAKHGRPSLTWSARRFGRWQEYATFHGWAQGWLHRWRVYSTFEDITLVISAPQEGKSARAAGSILDAPGPVVATSIRGDLITATAGLRSRVGTIHVFNPEGVGDYSSTFRWNPVAGCQDPVTAIRRAGHMVEAQQAKGLADADFWSDQASLVLAAYLHAAGLIGGNMRTVYQWIMERSEEPVDILTHHPQAAENAVLQVNEYLNMPERTRSGVVTTLSRVLKFMQDPAIVDILSPQVGEGFDFANFLASKDTVYLVAADSKTSPVSPLFVAFLAELTHWARLHPARTGAKRLDPPLSMELDEVANIAPVPVANWATWAAGSGIRINLYVQAWAQVEERWGREGAATIWQAAKTKVIFTAGSEDALCEWVSNLCGKVRVPVVERDGGKKRRRWELVDVLPAADVRRLPDSRAVVIRRNARPTIVRTEQVWKRADVKAYRRSGEQLALPAPVRRAVPTVRPELLEQVQAAQQAQITQRDDLAARRAQRARQAAPPLELPDRGQPWNFGEQLADPPAGQPGASRTDSDTGTGGPWRPWHGARPAGE